VSGTLASHEPEVVPVEISWMAEGPGKVAPIGPVGTERPPGADATHSATEAIAPPQLPPPTTPGRPTLLNLGNPPDTSVPNRSAKEILRKSGRLSCRSCGGPIQTSSRKRKWVTVKAKLSPDAVENPSWLAGTCWKDPSSDLLHTGCAQVAEKQGRITPVQPQPSTAVRGSQAPEGNSGSTSATPQTSKLAIREMRASAGGRHVALDEVVRTANPSTVVGVVRALQLELKDTKGSQKVNRTPADVESVLVLRCGISACAECGVGYLYCQSA